MRGIRLALAGLTALSAASAAASEEKAARYYGPGVYEGPAVSRTLADLVIVDKSDRRLTLYSKGKAIGHYRVALGGVPEGHKQAEGDGRTPEGLYAIDRRNPRSSFHLSIGISYPNARDMARATAAGVRPGGDIFIHGQPNGYAQTLSYDWTNGCIAVKNEEIREIWSRVPNGTPVAIQP